MLRLIMHRLLILSTFYMLVSSQFSTQHRRTYFSTKENRYAHTNSRRQDRVLQRSGLQIRLAGGGGGATSVRKGPNTCGSVCCRGWKLSEQGYCILPICNPPCQNQGLCVLPDKCRCKFAYQGKTCAFKRYGSGLAAMLESRKTKTNQNGRLVTVYTLPRALSPLESRKARTCLSVHCQNGGGCLRGRCICPRNFIGPRCERPVPKISTTPRFNSNKSMYFRTFPRSVCRYLCKYGSCVPTETLGRSTCSCFANYRGPFCDVKSVSMTQRPRAQRYSTVSKNGHLGNCYTKYRRNVCSLAMVGKRTAKSCCSRYGVAWGPRCTPCYRIRGLRRTKRLPSTMHCPRGFVRTEAACQDINECNISPTKCLNGRCVNVRGSFWCLCDAGFRLSRTRKTCLPHRTREMISGTCYTSLKANGRCPIIGALRGKKSDCCCSVGVAWGHNCELCPSHGSDEKRRLCPFGTLHPEVIPGRRRDSHDIDISTTQTLAPYNATTGFPGNPHTTQETELQENNVANQNQTEILEPRIDLFDINHHRRRVDKTLSVDLFRNPGSTMPGDTVSSMTTPIETTPATPELSAQEATAESQTLFSTQAITKATSKDFLASTNDSTLAEICLPTSCLNGGICQASAREKSISCACKAEFHGPRCEQERLQTCYLDSRTCENPLAVNVTVRECCCSIGRAWGQCKACPRFRSASYRKLCPHGRGLTQQPHSLDVLDINECDIFDSEKTCRNGKCVNSHGAFECICRRGYYYNRQRKACWDVNECSRREKCIGGTCMNSIGSYKCVCPQGRALRAEANGQKCVKLNQQETSTSEENVTRPTFAEESLESQRTALSSPFDSTNRNMSLRFKWKQPCFTKWTKRAKCSTRFSVETSYKKCCCSIGKAWGARCSLCPRRDSGQYKALCSNKGSSSKLRSLIRTQRKKISISCSRMKCVYGTCMRRKTGLWCICSRGYRLNPSTRTCEDINECIARRRFSSRMCIGGRCINTNGSFRCKCLNGWKPSPTRPTACIRKSAVTDTIHS